MHQLVDPAGMMVGKLAMALARGQLHHLAGAVGHVDLELLGGGMWEEHLNLVGVVGGGGVILPHVFKIDEMGSGHNRYLYPKCLRLGDLHEHAVLKAAALIVGDESADRVIMGGPLADDGDDQRRLIDHTHARGLPAARRFLDRMA